MGAYTLASETEVTITYPRSFSTVYSVVLTKEGTYGDSAQFRYYAVKNITKTSFSTMHYINIDKTHWIAVGIS